MASQLTIDGLRAHLASWDGPGTAPVHLLLEEKVLGVTSIKGAALHATSTPRPMEAGQATAVIVLHDTGQRLLKAPGGSSSTTPVVDPAALPPAAGEPMAQRPVAAAAAATATTAANSTLQAPAALPSPPSWLAFAAALAFVAEYAALSVWLFPIELGNVDHADVWAPSTAQVLEGSLAPFAPGIAVLVPVLEVATRLALRRRFKMTGVASFALSPALCALALLLLLRLLFFAAAASMVG